MHWIAMQTRFSSTICVASAVAAVASEEAAEVVVLSPDGAIAVAIDPLDGSNNVDVNAPLGTVFSLLPVISTQIPEDSFLAPGAHQLAARIYPVRATHSAGADTRRRCEHLHFRSRISSLRAVPVGRRGFLLEA